MDLCWQSNVSGFNMLPQVVISFLPRGKCLLISWQQSPSAVILEPKKLKSDTVSTVSPSISHEVMGPTHFTFVLFIFYFWLCFVVAHGLSSNGARAQLPRYTSDLLGSGIKPVSPVLRDRFLTTEPLGNPHLRHLWMNPYYV